MVIRGMVHYCYTKITLKSSSGTVNWEHVNDDGVLQEQPCDAQLCERGLSAVTDIIGPDPDGISSNRTSLNLHLSERSKQVEVISYLF